MSRRLQVTGCYRFSRLMFLSRIR